jgi:hypothetical protein
VSLGGELGLVGQVLAAAAELLKPTALGEDLSPEHGREVLAVVWLAQARVELLRRAVVGAVDPALLRAPFNHVLEPRRPGDDPDIVLRAWGRRGRIAREREPDDR